MFLFFVFDREDEFSRRFLSEQDERVSNKGKRLGLSFFSELDFGMLELDDEFIYFQRAVPSVFEFPLLGFYWSFVVWFFGWNPLLHILSLLLLCCFVLWWPGFYFWMLKKGLRKVGYQGEVYRIKEVELLERCFV